MDQRTMVRTRAIKRTLKQVHTHASVTPPHTTYHFHPF